MPGIVTHSKVLKDSIALLSKRKKKSYLHRSIQALFNSDEYLTAGLFGSIGPNIFDYLPLKKFSAPFGSDISFYLHNGGSAAMSGSMIDRVFSYPDKNNEWAAFQRAYLYGFISHVVADSIFHPFVFFFSGFPDSDLRRERILYRERNLLFQYNIDNYFRFHDEERTPFSLEGMLPVDRRRIRPRRINQPVKALIMESLLDCRPEFVKSLAVRLPFVRSGENDLGDYNILDAAPWCVRAAYRLKFTMSERVRSIVGEIRRRDRFFSDFFVLYPERKKLNRDALNFHGERWQYPAGRPGSLYDSVEALMRACCEKTVDAWERLEAGLYGDIGRAAAKDLDVNAYTGEARAGYGDMRHKNPLRLRL